MLVNGVFTHVSGNCIGYDQDTEIGHFAGEFESGYRVLTNFQSVYPTGPANNQVWTPYIGKISYRLINQ